MKVLLINNHHKIIGGAERYYFDLGSLLTKNGHQVAYFSTKDAENQKTQWSKYFIKKLDFKTKSLANSIEKFPKIFYSFEAKKNIARLLDKFKPDVVHIQNLYYYITPSILTEIKKSNIPVVQTVHDYQLISPSVVMFHDGAVCETTKIHRYYKAILHKCVKGSYMATLMSVVTLYFQNLNNFYDRSIDAYVAPSIFMKKKLEEYGLSKNKLIQIGNFVKQTKLSINQKGIEKYVLYSGRICEAKGIFLLLSAASKLPGVKFKIAGNFEDDQVKKQVADKIEDLKIKNLEFLGFRNSRELAKLISGSAFVIVPSLWYENQPYSILEAYALGKAVVACRIGGIPEMVKSGKTGLLSAPGDVNGFVRNISKLWNTPTVAREMGKRGKKITDLKHNPTAHYKEIFAVYDEIINNQK